MHVGAMPLCVFAAVPDFSATLSEAGFQQVYAAVAVAEDAARVVCGNYKARLRASVKVVVKSMLALGGYAVYQVEWTIVRRMLLTRPPGLCMV